MVHQMVYTVDRTGRTDTSHLMKRMRFGYVLCYCVCLPPLVQVLPLVAAPVILYQDSDQALCDNNIIMNKQIDDTVTYK
jgi:hypothetical protein